MKINNNIPALRTLNQLNKANDRGSKTMLRLSSGLRINSAADDAAGLAISQKMDTQVRGLQQANKNAMDGISMIQTAEGAYNEVHAMLQRMRELTLQGANGTLDESDKEAIKAEIMQLQEELIAIRDRTEFNKKNLLNGSHDKFMLQVGANENQSMKITGSDMNLDGVLSCIYGMEINLADDISMGKLPAGTTISYDGITKVIADPPGALDPALVDPFVEQVSVPANTLVVIKLPSTPVPTPVELKNGVLPSAPSTSTTIKAGEKIVFKTGNTPVVFNKVTGTPPNTTQFTPDADTAVILPTSNAQNKSLLNFNNIEETDNAIQRLDKAIETASKIRGKLGAYQNRLEHTVSNLGVSEENITASLSRIRDADMALEMTNYTQHNILSQAATAMLAQANQRPQQILQLLQR